MKSLSTPRTQRKPRVFLCVLSALCVLCVAEGRSQLRRPKAEVTALVERTGVHAGDAVRVALKVSLPEGLHTQSNKPRDPLLIPTELSFDPPTGVTVNEIVWPPATDFNQAGQDKPLAVFEREFVIGVQLSLPSTAAGDLAVPAKLRYQACDANLCYPPQSAEVVWPVHVLPASTATPPADAATASAFAAIAWGKGERPGSQGSKGLEGSQSSAAKAQPGDAVAKLDEFTVLGTSGGYLGSEEFLTFIHNAETGVKPRGMFEGRGPLMILLIVFLGGLALNLTPCVLPMIPINLAIIGAGTQSGIGCAA